MSGADEFKSCLFGVIVRVLFSFSMMKVLFDVVDDSVVVVDDDDVVDSVGDDDNNEDAVVNEDDDEGEGDGDEDDDNIGFSVCIVSGLTVKSE